MTTFKTVKDKRTRRHLRIRKNISGTADCPRMCVSVTASNIYVQFIDDVKGVTLASCSTLDKEFKGTDSKANVAGAQVLGKIAAERAKAAGVTSVVFDRSGFRYHGKVKAIAEAAREAGLKF